VSAVEECLWATKNRGCTSSLSAPAGGDGGGRAGHL